MRVQRLSGNDRGAVAVLVAMMGVFLTGMLAFAADLGHAYSVQRRLSTAADGAALAAAQELVNRSLTNSPPCGAAVDPVSAAAARGVADDYSSSRNAPGSALQAGAAGFALSCVPTGGLVTVRNSQRVDYIFGNLFGIGNSTPTGQATAQYGVARTVTGLRPYGLCGLDPLGAVALATSASITTFDLRPTVRVTLDKTKSGKCGTAPGNWGVLNLAGAGSPPNTPSIEAWTQFGYPGELDLINGTLTGNPGAPNPGALESEMNSIVGTTITLPVYDTAKGNGSNAQFHITGFISATLCNWKFGNKSGNPAAPCQTLLPVGGGSDPDFLELRYRETLTVGDFLACNPGCPVHGVRPIALVPTP